MFSVDLLLLSTVQTGSLPAIIAAKDRTCLSKLWCLQLEPCELCDEEKYCTSVTNGD